MPAWAPPALTAGESVKSYDSPTTMRVDEPGTGPDSLVQSSWPLVANGRPVDVGLDPVADGWSPRNTTVATRIAEELGGGTRLGSGQDALIVRPGGAPGLQGELVDDKVFYANAQTDTDAIVEAVPTGARVAWTLRSPAAPAATSLDLQLPSGATLSENEGAIEISRDGAVVGRVERPIAFDAQGQAVEVHYELSGSTVTVEVAHQGRDLAYPVTVDPVVVYHGEYSVYDLNPNNNDVQRYGWITPSAPGYGQFFIWWDDTATPRFVLGSQNAPAGSAAWAQVAPGTAFFSRAEFPQVAHTAANSCAHVGIVNWNAGSSYLNETHYTEYWRGGTLQGTGSSTFTNCSGMTPAWVIACAGASCQASSGTSGNQAATELYLNGASNNAFVEFRGAYMWLRDPDSPTFSISNAPPSGWTNVASRDITFQANDPGLGIGNNSAAPQPAAWISAPYMNMTWLPSTGVPWCDGTAPARCPHDATMTTHVDLADGQYALESVVSDIIGHQTHITQQAMIDTQPPNFDLSGRLASLVDAAGPSTRAVSKRMRLDVAADGTFPGRTTAGVTLLKLTVSQSGHADDVVQATSSGTGRLALANPYDFDPSLWAPGAVHFKLQATDEAGNTATRDFDLTVARGEITTLLEGQRTAKRLVLQAKDLHTPGPSQVTLQYRKKSDPADQWTNVPLDAMRTDHGDALSSQSLPLSNGLSTKVVWDIVSTLGNATEPVFVRGWFGSGAGEVTQDVLTVIDASGMDTDDAQTDIGPGQVDLLTGNFSLSDTDVNIDSFKSDLGISRTYNSKADLTDASGPFGPGWTLGMPMLASGTNYLKVTDYSASTDDSYGVAALTTADGGEIIFDEHENDDGYYSEPGFEDLVLTRTRDANRVTTGFTLVDRQTNETLTYLSKGVAGTYELSAVSQAASNATITFRYDDPIGDHKQRLVDVLAPVAPNIDCSDLTTVGCRSLHLHWNDSGRITEVDLRAPGTELGSQLTPVAQYEYDDSNRLSAAWDPRISPALKTTYAYDSANRLTSVTPPGENAWTMAYDANDPGRLRTSTRPTPTTTGTQQATQTVVFGVGVSGSGAPYDMSPTSLQNWSQDDDLPTDAAALFRPDDVPSGTPSSYAKATVSYLDALGRLVNTARPGGEISTIEHDAAGDPVRELTAANRSRALATGTTVQQHADRADQLSTARTFTEESDGTGWRMVDELGPIHATKLDNGSTVQARKHTQVIYDEGKTDTKVHNLPTTTTVSAWVSGSDPTHDARTTKTEYDWALGLPTKTRVDPSGLNLTTTTVYDSGGQGLVVRERRPRSANADAASTRKTIYYTAGSNPEDSACGSAPQWANRPCKILAGGTTTNGLGSLPVSVFEYDAYGHETRRSDYVDGSERRRVVTVYQGDRVSSEETTSPSSTGMAFPKVEYGYSLLTGRQVTEQFSTSPQRTITTGYDAVGRVISYTDGDGAQTQTAYDLLGRPVSITDPIASTSMNYNGTTARLAQLSDSSLGSISADYDADGNLTGEHFGIANLDLTLSYDETGDLVKRDYRRASPCTSNCGQLTSEAISSIHGQQRCDALSRSGSAASCDTSTGAIRTYAYDAAGRLTKTEDQRDRQGCVTRTYDFADNDSNRWHRRTYPAAADGSCSTTTTPSTQTLSYDEADRVATSGTQYDSLGRTTNVPANDAGGTPLTASYYTTDRARSIQQDGVTTSLDLDPAQRVRSRATGAAAAEINHYEDDSDEPAWTQQGSAQHRNIPDIVGDLAAIQTVGGPVALQLSDLHGDIAGQLDNTSSATSTAVIGGDEFGVPRRRAEPITVVGATKQVLTSAATGLTIGRPSGVQDGDLLVAQIVGAGNATITPPSGWTAVAGGTVTGGTGRYQLLYRVAGTSEPASYAFAMSASDKHLGAITALRNTATTNPISDVATASGSGVNITTPSVTPPDPDSARDHGFLL